MSLKLIANSGMTVEYEETSSYGTSAALTATGTVSTTCKAEGAGVAMDGYTYTVTISLSGYTSMIVTGVTLNSTCEKVSISPLLLNDTSDTQTTTLTNASSGATIPVIWYLKVTDAGQSSVKAQ